MSYLHEDKNFHDLLEKINRERQIDLTEYRPRCLGRRIDSRLRAVGAKTVSEYIEYLDKNPSEYKKLLDNVTINVTQFFRNAEVFEAIRKQVLPELFDRKLKEGKKNLRVWSAGCASGEEAYSVAILIKEFLGDKYGDFLIKIFGTDIDRDVIEKAREGKYSLDAFKEMPERLKEKYFSKEGDGFAVSPELKKITEFMCGDLVKDEPLERIDLILCRNVVIYFSRELSSRVYASFYRGLNPKGYLVLGKVEALWGEVTKYFKAVDNRERIYQKIV